MPPKIVRWFEVDISSRVNHQADQGGKLDSTRLLRVLGVSLRLQLHILTECLVAARRRLRGPKIKLLNL